MSEDYLALMTLQKIVAIALLVSLMLEAGLEINRAHLRATLKDYGLFGRALLANFIIVPLLGVILARAFRLEGDVAIGFILMAIAPGVPFLVRAAGRQLGGSLEFAAELAFAMPAISIVTIPITARLVFPGDVQARLHVVQLIVTLVVFQLLPLLIGLVIADRYPRLVPRLRRPLLAVFIVTIVALLAVLGPQVVRDVARITGSGAMLAALILVLLSTGIGWLFGGPEEQYRRTLTISTALRNVGTCAVIATESFPQSAVTATVLAYFVVQTIVSIVFRIYFWRTAARTSPA